MLSKYRTKTTTLLAIVVLMSAIASMTLVFQPAEAQPASQQPVSGPLPAGVVVDKTMSTTTFLSFRPNPIGVGQQLLVNMWINPALASNNRLIPKGFRVTITKPDESNEVFTLDSEPATGAMWFEYSPDRAGEWKLKVEFLGTYFPAGRYYNGYIVTNTSGTVYGSAYYQPSATKEQTLTVQQDFIWSWPPAPLPTDYWTRPASLNNREWWPILGNYPGTGYKGGGTMWDTLYPDTNIYDSPDRYNFHPWVQGPNTAHIVWKRQDAIAGLTGGPAGQYGTTSSPASPSVVYAGRAYATVTKPIVGSVAQCYDLRTGQIYYEIPTSQGGVTPSYLAYIGPSQAALATSSWSVELLSISGGRLLKVNPLTGAVTGNYSISPLTTGTYTNQIDGYVMSVQDLGATAANATGGRYRLINWTTRGTSATLTGRMMSNISWPWSNLPNQYVSATGICVADYNAGIAAFVTRTTEPGTGIYWGINVTAANLKTGQMLSWKVSVPDEATYSGSCVVADHGKVAILTQTGCFLAYDLNTGQLAWKSEIMDYPWGQPSFGAYAIQSAYGMLFRQSYDGVYAFNWTNGKIVWKYVSPTYASFESPYITDGQEHYSFNSGGEIADGKMYVYNSEHTTSWPITRGWGLHCINITTGELIWKIVNPMTVGAIADGYLAAPNSWDGSLYVFGRGKSSTTVTATPAVIADGSAVLIQGTVLDQSPAQPNTPCVSKDSMTTQMEYLHLQEPSDGLWHNESLTGVSVSLTAFNENGDFFDIATVTTNGYYGTFAQSWTPPNEGIYEIVASFVGDDSYGSSAAATAVSVGPAPEEPEPLPEAVVPDDTMTIVGTGVAIIIAIAVATGLVLLKKR
jgi:hypothetical protein